MYEYEIYLKCSKIRKIVLNCFKTLSRMSIKSAPIVKAPD